MKHTTHTLGFSITPHISQEDDLGSSAGGTFEALFAECRPTFYGGIQEEGPYPFFDLQWVIAQGVIAGEFEPFTCSCGVAGCAGIHEESFIGSNDQEVHWLLHQDPFSRFFPQEPIKDGYITLRFNRAEYEATLANATIELEALEKMHNLGVMPVGMPQMTKPGIKDRIAEYTKHIIRRNAEREDDMRLFGHLWGTEVLLCIGGREYTCSTPRMLELIAFNHPECTQRGMNHWTFMEERLLTKAKSGALGLRGIVEEAGVEVMKEILYLEKEPDAHQYGSLDDCWPHFTLVLRQA